MPSARLHYPKHRETGLQIHLERGVNVDSLGQVGVDSVACSVAREISGDCADVARPRGQRNAQETDGQVSLHLAASHGNPDVTALWPSTVRM
jgi:hypothetical protein